MSQQELDEVDKIIEEIIIFGSVNYVSLADCVQEAKKHFLIGEIKARYIMHFLRKRADKSSDTRNRIIENLRENILNGHREEN